MIVGTDKSDQKLQNIFNNIFKSSSDLPGELFLFLPDSLSLVSDINVKSIFITCPVTGGVFKPNEK
jgi:hypothetical protein